jgi:hypothetical protein
MYSSDPIDIAGYKNVNLECYLWYQTEKDYDKVSVKYSYFGSNWFDITEELSGSSNGWVRIIHNLPNDHPDTYYIEFEFESDDMVRYEGAYVDDIIVRGEEPPMPNLTYSTPYGWSAPIVISHEMNSGTTSGVLYTGQVAYINWGITNNGDSASTSCPASLYIDDQWIGDYWVSYLEPGETDASFHNVEHVFQEPGIHNVRIEIDCYNWVDEKNENDNIRNQSFQLTMGPPNLAFFTPSGWEDSLVVSMDPYSRNNAATLYAGVECYVHFAIINNGSSPSNSFYTRLYVNGSLNTEFFMWSIDVNDYHLEEAIPLVLSAGNNQIRVEIDYYNVVMELHEDDNIFIYERYWETCPLISTSGIVEYLELGAQPGLKHKAKGYKVQLWDKDLAGDTARTWLTEPAFTDDNGYFEFPAIINIDNDGTALDIFVRAFANNDAAIVTKDVPSAGYDFFFDGIVVANVTTDTYHWNSIEADSEQSGYFYVADVIRENYLRWKSLRPDPCDDPGFFYTLLSDTASGSFYDSTNDFICISSKDNPDLALPDAFDKDVISHEYGHKLHYSFGFFNRPDTSCEHLWQSILSPGLAAREGFADFWAMPDWNNPIL